MPIAQGARPCPKCTPPRRLDTVCVDVPGVSSVVEIDRCAGCGGVWLDWDEDRTLHVFGAIPPGTHGAARWKDDLKRGACPSCDLRPTLTRIAVGAFGVDRCPDCHGLFFDGGELPPLLTVDGFSALKRALRQQP